MADEINIGFISSLERTNALTPEHLFETSEPSAETESGFFSRAATLDAIAKEVNNGIEYASELQTDSKTIIGAINEINQGGGGGGGGASIDDNIIANNKTWSSSKINDEINIINHGDVNFTDGIYLFKDQIRYDDNYILSDFIRVPEGVTTITWYHGGFANDHQLSEYDENKQWINDGYWNPRDKERTITFVGGTRTKYIRATFYKPNLANGYDKITYNNGELLYQVKTDDFGLEEVKTQVVNMQENLTEVNQELTKVNQDLDNLHRSVSALWGIEKGQIYDIIEQTEAGTNIAPNASQFESLISVEGKSDKITTRSVNLAPPPATNQKTKTQNGVTITHLGDGIYKVTGTATADSTLSLFLEEPFEIPVSKGNGGNGVMYLFNSQSFDNSSGIRFQNDANETIHTFNLQTENRISNSWQPYSGGTEVVTRIGIRYISGTTYDLTFKPMVVDDGVETYSYKPYYVPEITSVEEINFKINSRNLCPNKIGKTTNTGAMNYSTNGSFGEVIEGETYTLSFDNLTSSTAYSQFRIYTTTSNYTSQTSKSFVANRRNTLTFTAVASGSLAINNSLGSTYASQVVIDNIQLEYGSIAHDYTPYEELVSNVIIPPFPLNKISDYADVCDIDKGIWIKNIKKVDLDSYTWGRAKVSNPFEFYRFKTEETIDILSVSSGTDMPYILCSVLKNGSISQDESNPEDYYGYDDNRISIGFSAPNIYAKCDSASNDSEFLEKISGQHLLYVSVNPTIEPVSESDLSFLRSLQKLSAGNVITITDQNGNDITYLMEYIIKLSEVN